LPQLFGSVCVLTHRVPQVVSPFGQVAVQLPLWQMEFGPQMLPQLPQFASSVWGLVQVPAQRMSGAIQLNAHCP